MVFNRILGALGVGGPSIDTVLSTPTVRPGGSVQGQVNIVGGSHEVGISGITLTLVARVETEHGGGEEDGLAGFATVDFSGPFRLAAGERRAVPFSFPIPFETPVTAVGGQRLSGMTVGVCTEVEVAGMRDKSDADPLNVEPLPVQQQILDAFIALGFVFKGADLEAGHIRGTGQVLPFHQEIEFRAAPQYAHACSEVELTFLAAPHQVEVVLEVDRRSGSFGGGDVVSRHVIDHAAAQHDLTAQVDTWIREALEAYGARGSAPYSPWASPGKRGDAHAYGHGVHCTDGYAPDWGHGHRTEDDGRRGPGMGAVVGGVVGGVVAGAALGFVGGMIVGEVVEEAVEDVAEEVVEDIEDIFEGDDGDDGGDGGDD